MNETLERLNNLVNSGKAENVELASALCKSQGIAFNKLKSYQEWKELIRWLGDYREEFSGIRVKTGIRKCFEKTILRINFKDISYIPPSLFKLKNLTDLDLSYNSIETIPKELGELRNLVRLRLNHNRIKELPNSICNLSKLGILNLSNNNISILPPDLDKLKYLGYFYAEGNNIPQSDSTLKNLNKIVKNYPTNQHEQHRAIYHK